MKRFTLEEDERLEALRLVYVGTDRGRPRLDSGCRGGLSQIAEIMGRAKSSVQIRLDHLAAKAEGGKSKYHTR